MKTPVVSVVVPVYNVEKYLDLSIGSIVKQTYADIEIILVDDGSTDNSGKKCDTWAKKDKRIKVLHKKNEGLNYARRDGFNASSGKYITFLDSDDLLHVSNIEASLKRLVAGAGDVLVYAHSEFSDSEKNLDELIGSVVVSCDELELSNKDEIIRYALLGESGFLNSHYMTAWGKLYKRETLDTIDWSLSNFRSYEDNFWTPQALMAARKVILISEPLYFYRRNESYGTLGVTLGNRLVGNTKDGKPVGFLEFINLLYIFYLELAMKHEVDIRERLIVARNESMWWRLRNLIEEGLIEEENNLDYLKDTLTQHYERDNELSSLVARQGAEITLLQSELDMFMRIKPTARRLVGNIKRKLIKGYGKK